jgi:hypothetical protein
MQPWEGPATDFVAPWAQPATDFSAPWSKPVDYSAPWDQSTQPTSVPSVPTADTSGQHHLLMYAIIGIGFTAIAYRRWKRKRAR